MIKPLGYGILLALLSLPASAEVIEASPAGYKLRHEATSSLSVDDMWQRLIHPESWWDPSHTYSADSSNLSLKAEAGGAWREDWPGGSVLHGTILTVVDKKMLRLDAPFGPLQSSGATVIWTITLKEKDAQDGGGTLVVFDETATGGSKSALDTLAPAVDAVKQQAIKRLVTPSL